MKSSNEKVVAGPEGPRWNLFLRCFQGNVPLGSIRFISPRGVRPKPKLVSRRYLQQEGAPLGSAREARSIRVVVKVATGGNRV
jgi:hypothetical protein